jgi:hypothetical protein
MRVLPAIFANVVLFVSALGFGGWLRHLLPERFSPIDRIAVTLLGGLGLLGTALFCVGQFWFSRSAIVFVLLLGVAPGLMPVAQALRKSRATLSNISLPLLPVAIVATVLLVTAIGGLALPTGDMNNDSIAYHYLGPKVWLRDRLIRPVPDEILTAFPAVVETQYAALMALGGQRAPQFFALISVISILLVTAGLAIRLGLSQSGSWWAAALIITMPAVYHGAYGGMLDVLFAAFVLAAARVSFDAETPRHYALCGVICGIAMATKYTGLVASVLLVLCSFVTLIFLRRKNYSVVLQHLGISCATAIAVALPFYLRNWILLGSPIVPPPPLLSWFVHVRYFSPKAVRLFHAYIFQRGRGLGRGLESYVLLPFNLTFHTSNFHGAGGIGLSPLSLGPIGLIASRRDWFSQSMALLAFGLTTAWFCTQQESRFLIHVYLIAALFAVIGWQYISLSASTYAQVLSALAVACSLIYGLITILPDRRDDLHAVLSSSFEVQRRLRETPFLESFDYLNRDPSVSKVLLVDPYVAAYYSDKSYVKPLGRWGEETFPDAAADVQKILATLPRLHISHVLDVKSPAGTFRLPDHPPGLTLVFQRADQQVYRVD